MPTELTAAPSNGTTAGPADATNTATTAAANTPAAADSQRSAAIAGDAVFRALAGPGDTAPWDAVADLAPALGQHVRAGLGALVGNPALDLRTRELATVCMLAALGGVEPQLAFHTRGALRAGAEPAEIVEAVAQAALYAGIPRALNALAVVRRELAAAAQ